MNHFILSFKSQLQPWLLSKFGVNLFTSALIILAAYTFYLIVRRGLRTLHKKEILPLVIVNLTTKSLKYLLALLTLFLILQNHGITLNALWGTLSAMIAMVAIGFVAVWSVISNTLCALILIVTKPFRIGDTIELVENSSTQTGAGGVVVNISLMYTTLLIRKSKNTVMIPNNLFFQKMIRRHEGKQTYSLDEQLMTPNSLLQKEIKR